MANLRSPLTNGEIIEIAKIKVDELVTKYLEQFNLDVSEYFHGNNVVSIYKCVDTGYCFYYPFTLSGDNKFYAHFQKFEWYYMSWKWEHQKVYEFVKPDMKVLEVGCGNGDFLERIQKEKGAHCIGLELNEKAAEKGKKIGLNIATETIEEHSFKNECEYDLVCAFQVLEHISGIRSFLNAIIKCLKTDGILVLSVPNNDSFLKHGDNILNMPPHHMGLWNKKSLLSLSNYFPIAPEQILLEPLQSYHKIYFRKSSIQFLRKKFKIASGVLNIFYPLIEFTASRNYKAFTIQVWFRKNETT